MFEQVKIAPSILSANFINLGADVEMLESAGADVAHIDVMDGHFVPNLSFGIPLVKHLAKTTKLLLDVHLMISNPLYQLPWFLDAGAHSITIHLEALETSDEAHSAISLARSAGARIAFAIKPHTATSLLIPYLSSIDMALVMSVEPGFSGQSYIEGTEDRIAEVARAARISNPNLLLQADGGVSAKTAARVARAGADVLVCGNAIFSSPTPDQAIANIREVANKARKEALHAGEAFALKQDEANAAAAIGEAFASKRGEA